MTAREQALDAMEAAINSLGNPHDEEDRQLQSRLANAHQALHEAAEPDPQANALAAKIRAIEVRAVEASGLAADLPNGYWNATIHYFTGNPLYCGVAPDGRVSS